MLNLLAPFFQTAMGKLLRLTEFERGRVAVGLKYASSGKRNGKGSAVRGSTRIKESLSLLAVIGNLLTQSGNVMNKIFSLIVKPVKFLWYILDGKKTYLGAITSLPVFIDSIHSVIQEPSEAKISAVLAQALLYTGVVDKLRKQLKED